MSVSCRSPGHSVSQSDGNSAQFFLLYTTDNRNTKTKTQTQVVALGKKGSIMKTISKFSLVVAVAVSCLAGSPTPSAPVRHASFPLFELDGAPLVVDSHGAAVTAASDPATKLYNNRFCDAHKP